MHLSEEVKFNLKTEIKAFKKVIGFAILVNLSIATSLNAATVTATGTGGEWTTGSTWVGGIPPVSGTDDVVIPAGSVVTITNQTVNFNGTVTVDGTLSLIATGLVGIATLTMSNALSIVVVNAGGNITNSNASLLGWLNGILIGGNYSYSPVFNGDPNPLDGPVQIEDGGITPLPIVLNFFKARQIDQDIAITWQSATELNNDYYTIERSRDGKEYETIAQIPGKGTTNEPQDYHHLDKRPFLGISYYRLKQTDYDGTSEIFGPVVVRFIPSQDQMVIAPNPVTNGKFTIQVTGLDLGENALITISNLNGQQLYAKQINTGENDFLDQMISINPGMQTGIYILAIRAGSRMESGRLMISH